MYLVYIHIYQIYVCIYTHIYLVSLTASSPEKPPLQSPMEDGYYLVCGVMGLFYLCYNNTSIMPSVSLLPPRVWSSAVG